MITVKYLPIIRISFSPYVSLDACFQVLEYLAGPDCSTFEQMLNFLTTLPSVNIQISWEAGTDFMKIEGAAPGERPLVRNITIYQPRFFTIPKERDR